MDLLYKNKFPCNNIKNIDNKRKNDKKSCLLDNKTMYL